MASPNIWEHTATYEVENRAVDPHGRLASTLRGLATWQDATALDLGCGTGFHLPSLADDVGPDGRVVGVEPHPDLLALARRRTRSRENVSVLQGTAQAVPLPDASVDVVHARWAYFFGPGCEPGLAELDRVVRRGGVALVIDNDASRSTFGAWFRRGYPHLPSPQEIERFWATRGWTRTPVDMGWSFASRADLEAVVRIELKPDVAEEALRHHHGTDVDYAVNVWSKTF
ncbi:class I SAM-dependent methyltransferase [Nocardioides lijunqiniae]|uniref:class I SAM-dependent methyltransferase n=1 Tax=Nocardioides lijunqiniae TaxID=2760832 RepID=UPI0030B8176C